MIEQHTIGVIIPNQRKRFEGRWKNLFNDDFFSTKYIDPRNDNINKQLDDVDLLWNDGNIGGERTTFKFLTETSIPIVTTIRGLFWKEGRSKKRVNEFKTLLDHSERVIVLSQKTKESMINEFPSLASKVRVVPNGIPWGDKIVEEGYSYHSPLRDNELKVLTVTNFIFEEKVRALKDLMKILNKQEIKFNLNFEIVGSHDSRPHTKEIKEISAQEERYNFIGEVDKEKLIKLYRDSDLFVYASYQDSQPSVLLEAMACSLPIICNTGLGFSEFIDAKAGFVKPLNEFNKAMHWLTNDELRASMSKTSKNHVVENFNWDNIQNRYANIFSNALNSGENMNLTHKRNWLIAFDELELVYSRVPKVASNSILHAIAEISDKEDDGVTRNRGKRGEVGRICKPANKAPHDYFFFSAVRNPYSRVLSFYCDKVRDHQVEAIISSYGITVEEAKNISFTDFVLHLKSVPYNDFEPHLWSQWKEFHLENADKIFKMENLDREFPKFIKKRYGEDIEMAHQLTTEHEDWQNYYTPETKEIIYDIYQEDFENLDYPKE